MKQMYRVYYIAEVVVCQEHIDDAKMALADNIYDTARHGDIPGNCIVEQIDVYPYEDFDAEEEDDA